MRKAIALTLSCMIIMAGAATVYGTEYTDVNSKHWAHEAVKAMSDKTIIKGYPNGSFQPNHTVTYGEFIKMAMIADTGEDAGNAAAGHWATNYYNKALEQKYFTVNNIGSFQLGSSITRGDMALIISSILGDVKIENYNEIQKGISDVSYQTKHEYDITKAYAYGILTGYTDNTFKPDKTLTRAESAMVIYRLVDESKRELPGGGKEEPVKAFKIVNTADYVDVSTVKNVKTSNTGDFTEKAELYNDASGFDMKIFRKFDGVDCSFDHTLNGFIYLVKDEKIVAYAATLPRYDEAGNFLNYYRSIAHVDVTNVDYIVCVSANVNTNIMAKIIPNPFNK